MRCEDDRDSLVVSIWKEDYPNIRLEEPRKRRKTFVWISGVSADISAGHLPNTILSSGVMRNIALASTGNS
jgi:hypothetical protein